MLRKATWLGRLCLARRESKSNRIEGSFLVFGSHPEDSWQLLQCLSWIEEVLSWAGKEDLWAGKSQVCNWNKTLLSKVWRWTLESALATVVLFASYTSKIKGMGFCYWSCPLNYSCWKKNHFIHDREQETEKNCSFSHCSRFNHCLTLVLRITYLWPLTILLQGSPKAVSQDWIELSHFLWGLSPKVPPHYWTSPSKHEKFPTQTA